MPSRKDQKVRIRGNNSGNQCGIQTGFQAPIQGESTKQLWRGIRIQTCIQNGIHIMKLSIKLGIVVLLMASVVGFVALNNSSQDTAASGGNKSAARKAP
jgi:hypothetical protein